MKESIKAKASGLEDEVDRISNLPDPILHLILSRLPATEEAIRTSILSRRWRHLWTLVPSVDIDYTRGLKPSQKELDSDGFREFVNWVLANKSLDLDSFRLRCWDFYNMSTIREWTDAAVMRKVKLIDLRFRPKENSETIELPQSLVTCNSLEVLRLCLIGRALCLPKFTGFPALRVLELNQVNLYNDDKLVKYFLESCPLLEDLSLIHFSSLELVISCPKLKTLRIDTLGGFRMCESLEICCPKLEFLELTGYVALKFLLQNLYSLKEAVIHCKDLFVFEVPTFDFFATISRVEYLSISVYCIGRVKQVMYPNPRQNAPISLPNLKTLEISLTSCYVDLLISFLECLPDLESLHLVIPKNDREWDDLNHNELVSFATMSILTRHLKKVEFLKYDGEYPKLDVVRAFLEHGNILNEMVFSWGDKAKFHERSMEIMKEVSNFHKASSTVKITSVLFNLTPNKLGY